jgi:hypothetical protein
MYHTNGDGTTPNARTTAESNHLPNVWNGAMHRRRSNRSDNNVCMPLRSPFGTKSSRLHVLPHVKYAPITSAGSLVENEKARS